MKILVIPDGQCKTGVPTEHWTWLGKYIVDKQPDVIVNIGDMADMPSLSSYDVGKKSFEGRRYKDDVNAVIEAQSLLFTPLIEFNERAKRNKEKQYKPRLVLTLGNHEERILRAINSDSKLDGTLSIDDLCYDKFGWEVYPYLQPVIIEGVAFSHFFPSGVLGRPTTSARALITKMHMSCIAGHQQGRDIAYGRRADGTEITAIIAGSFYQHDEDYLNPLTNRHWRGVFVLHEIHNGSFDEMAVSIGYLRRKYA